MIETFPADNIERALIGSVLTEQQLHGRAIDVLPQAFRQRHLRHIWKAILALHNKGDAIDAETVLHVLDVEGKLKDAGGHPEIANCQGLAVPMHVDTYAKQVIEAAAKRGLESVAKKLLKMSQSGEDISANYRQAEALISKNRTRYEKVTHKEIKGIYSTNEILDMEFPDIEWVVPGVIPVGLNLLAGKPKIGKSWLALQIALAIGTGGRIFDEKVDEGKVLVLALEDSKRRLKNRLLKLNWPRDVPVEIMPMDNFRDTFGYLENGGGERLAERMYKEKYRAVLVDTFSKALNVDQNDRAPVDRALAPIHEMSHVNDCAVQIIDHHSAKNSLSTPDAVADVFGSTAKGATADCILGLYRKRGVRGGRLMIVGRDVEEKTLKLYFDVQTGAWQCEGVETEDDFALTMTKTRQAVIDAIDELDKPTVSSISKATGRDVGNVYKDLQLMIEYELVEKDEDTKQYSKIE